ncbi:DUF6402 family protein [Rouxiella sp. Mn2063]|uniref:DUF6402 family protein n=1 Tax=Rouxiella sp. Mn2063 TaxID=3395262 RepID=UPI003BCF8BA9
MNALKVKSKMTNEKDNKQEVAVKLFKITDIPDVMEKMGWDVSASFMRKWFNDPYYEMSKDEKLNKVDMLKVDKQHVIKDLDFDWLFTASKRVKPVINEFLSGVSYVREYNSFLGRKKTILEQLSNGLITIIERLDHMGIVDKGSKKLNPCAFSFSSLSAMELDVKSQFNYISIGSTLWEKVTDDLDDVYGALGSFIIKIAFLDIVVTEGEGGARLKINELGLYIRDTYEFMNDGDDQPLGYWGWEGVIKPGVISELFEKQKITQDSKDYYRVTNNSFVKYRNKNNKGGDFSVYSVVKKIPVDIVIHLSSIDIEEYMERKGLCIK